jgi:flagella basal body P-ring formation protein FlgA
MASWPVRYSVNLAKCAFFLIAILLHPALPLARQDIAGQVISPRVVEQVLKEFLAGQSKRFPHIEFHFSSINLPKPFTVPAGQIEYQVVPAKPKTIGSRRVTLLTRVDNQIVDDRSIRVRLEAIAEILVASDNLRRGEIISPRNVSYVEQDISRLKQPFYDGDNVYGMRLKRSIRLGTPLLRKQVERPPLIERGDRVVIQANRGGLLLTDAGEAKEKGRINETIRVINLRSRKVILGRVAEAGLVTVDF